MTAEQENKRLRELLRDCRMIVREVGYPKLAASIDAALSQQAEPVEPAPEPRDKRVRPSYLDQAVIDRVAKSSALHLEEIGRRLAEPAPAQDERECCCPKIGEPWNPEKHGRDCPAHQAKRPAQTEQQPILAVKVEADCVEHVHPEYGGGYFFTGDAIVEMYAAPIAQTAPQHPDDAAVGRFAAAMKAKLAKSRAKGRGGWDDPNVCSVEFLARLLVEHLGKGNAGTFEDVANFAMMLHQRGADPKVLAEAAEAPIKKARGEALELGVRALESKTAPQPEQNGSLNMEPEGANAYLVVDPDDNYHICYVVRSKDQALQHATDGLLAFGPITQGGNS